MGMDRSVAIETVGLGKVYDGVTAIENLSFKIYAGEVFGLLGPNGAGKSTTLRILITLIRPTSGQAIVLGHDVVREAERVRELIGYVPQERAVDRFLTGREHLQLLGDLHHLSKQHTLRRIDELLKLVDLERQADRPVKTYSGGMKRKLDLACGLLANPAILLLDEPTLGLDVQSRLRIWDHIRQLRDRGITVVMTTNYLDEADQLCDRLAIIYAGRIKAIGSPHELKVGLGGDIVSLTVAASDLSRVDALTSALKGIPSIRSVSTRPMGLDIRVESPEKALPAILEATNRFACRLEFIDYHRPKLDDVFVAHTGHAIHVEPQKEQPS
jgi:ABC-2 type transport system ATP-binding protein